MCSAGSASLTYPKWPLHFCIGSPHVLHNPTLPDRPIRGSRGPFVAGARSRARSYSARSHTCTTPWLTISWLELGKVLAKSTIHQVGSLRDPKSKLLDPFGKGVHHLLLHGLCGSSHGWKSMCTNGWARAALSCELVDTSVSLRVTGCIVSYGCFES